MVKTDVHYPTDINLLRDACRKTIEFAATVAQKYSLPCWRQHCYLEKQHKKRYHKVRNLKHSTSNCESKRDRQQQAIEMAHIEYLKFSMTIITKAEATLSVLQKRQPNAVELATLKYWTSHAIYQANLIYRRVLAHEVIPHEEKVFSLFEPHTEWICKGKAGVPMELGLRVCVLQDQFGFTLYHQVMQKQTDEQVTVPMAKEAKQRFSALSQVSYDKGFWSPDNLIQLEKFLERAVLPKKGKLSAEDKQRQSNLEFIRAKRKHSAVESDINALEAHGLDKCPDKGVGAFKRYVALAVVATNLQRLGKILLARSRSP